MTLLRLGVIGTSAKENEHRLPLHPEHVPRIDADIRARITLEEGYTHRFGTATARGLGDHVAGHASREEILAECDVVLLPKPQLAGLTGDYGSQLSAVVIGFGATARGAVTALNAHGVHQVAVLTNRDVAAVGSPIHSVLIRQLDHGPDQETLSHVITDQGHRPIADYLAENDIIVNCTLQDTAHPVTYLSTDDLARFRPASVVVDVSCDLGMGFEWARPTGFDDPTFLVGPDVLHYAVDHSPSYLWRSATWENSRALLPFLRPVLDGPAGWDADETVRRAIAIREGRLVDPAIAAFQGR